MDSAGQPMMRGRAWACNRAIVLLLALALASANVLVRPSSARG